MARSRFRRVPPAIALAAGLALSVTGCGGHHAPADPAPAPGPIPVVGTENFYGDLLTQICGARCAVTSLLNDPNADPHEYESSARDAAAVAEARLVIENGEGYDTFMDHLLAASPDPRRQVIRVQSLTGAPDGADPHLWYDPATMPKVAAAAASDLARIDPAHAADYQGAARQFTTSMQAVDGEIAAIRAAYPDAPVACTEPVFGYMGGALGLRVLTPPAFQRAVEDGNDPSAADLAAQEELLAGHRVRVLIYNLQTSTPVTAGIRDLARRQGVPAVGVTETEPAGRTYQQWMLDQLQAMAAALGEGGGAGGR